VKIGSGKVRTVNAWGFKNSLLRIGVRFFLCGSAIAFASAAFAQPLNDCNNNQIEDSQDIANQTSADCNGNSIPDECDIFMYSTLLDNCSDALAMYAGKDYLGQVTTPQPPTLPNVNNRDGASSCAEFDDSDAWAKYTPATSGVATFSFTSTYANSIMSVHTGCPGTVSNELGCTRNPTFDRVYLTVPVTAGNTYLVRFAGSGEQVFFFNFRVDGPLAVGQSADCNTNGVPDECELDFTTDANNNGKFDKCETASSPCANFYPLMSQPATLACRTQYGRQVCYLSAALKVYNGGDVQGIPRTIAYYASNDETWDASDQLVTSRLLFTRIYPDRLISVSLRGHRVDGSLAGKYLLAIVDYKNGVRECDESNNVVSLGQM
jgi:hypothetical protein